MQKNGRHLFIFTTKCWMLFERTVRFDIRINPFQYLFTIRATGEKSTRFQMYTLRCWWCFCDNFFLREFSIHQWFEYNLLSLFMWFCCCISIINLFHTVNRKIDGSEISCILTNVSFEIIYFIFLLFAYILLLLFCFVVVCCFVHIMKTSKCHLRHHTRR